MKELMALLRQKKEIEEKRNQLKKLILEKRDNMSLDEFDKQSKELNDFESQIRSIDEKIKKAEAEVNSRNTNDDLQLMLTDENQQNNNNNNNNQSNHLHGIDLENYSLTDEKRQKEILGSNKYREAFYRSIKNGKILKTDVAIMESGKRVITDMNTGSVVSGAEYLLPSTTLNQIREVIESWGNVYNLVEKLGFTGNVTIPIGTEDTLTDNGDGSVTLNCIFTEVTINQMAVVALVKAPNLLLKNSISAFEGYLVGQLGKYIGKQLTNYVLNGSGAAGIKFLGIITKIKAEGENLTYSSVNWKFLNDVQGGLESPYGDNAVFIMKRSTYFKKFRSVTDAMGRPLLTDVVNGPKQAEYYLVGQRVHFTNLMPPADIDPFLYGDLKTYLVNESEGIKIETSSENDTAFQQDETHWRGKVYSGGKPTLPTDDTFKYYVFEEE